MNAEKIITLEQTASAIGRPGSQRATLKGLGLNRIGRQSHQLRIPILRAGILPRDTFAHLHQRLLNVPRLLRIVQIFVQLLIS